MEGFFGVINDGLVAIDDFIWGVPLMVLILFGGILLTVRLRGVQFRQLPRALRYMIKNETGGEGEVTSFGALCTALSATIGTGNIVGVATAIVAGGPGAMFWMWLAALFGMATKFSEGLLAVKILSVDKKTGHVLGGPFYYIERGMGMKWRWLAKLFAFFGMCVGLFGIGTFTQVNSISSAITGFFDPEKNATVSILGMDYSIFTVIGSIVLAVLVGLVVIGGLKRIAKVSERVIPAMVVLYVGLSVLLIVTNLDKIPGAFVTIFESAFGLQAAAGGMLARHHHRHAEGHRARHLLERGRPGLRSHRRCRRSDEGAGAPGSRVHDRHVPRHHRGVLDDRPGAGHDGRVPDPRTRRRGRHHRRVPGRTTLHPRRSGIIRADGMSGAVRIHHYPGPGTTTASAALSTSATAR